MNLANLCFPHQEKRKENNVKPCCHTQRARFQICSKSVHHGRRRLCETKNETINNKYCTKWCGSIPN